MLTTALALPWLLTSRGAWAGSYLSRAAVLLEGSHHERDMAWSRSHDRELLRIVHAIAEARSKSARKMMVPKVVFNAHPHLLLVLDNCERAYHAALSEDYRRFRERIVRARIEDRSFRALIAKLGYELPTPKKR